MTPFQLRQWLSQNGKEDKWWLSIDAVTDEIPVTVAEIEERMKSRDYSAVQALHVSQAGMTNPTWTDVAVTPSPAKPTTTLDELPTDDEAPRRNRGSSDSIPPWGWIVIGGVLIAILVSFFYAAKIYVGIPLVLIPFGLVVTNWISKGKLFGCLLLLGLFLLTPCLVYLFFMHVDSFDKSVMKSRTSSTASESEDSGATGISLTLGKRKALYRDAILLEREAKQQAETLFPMPDVNSKEYRESGVALSILTKQNEEQDRIKKGLWKALVRDYGVTEDSLIEIIVEGSNEQWPKP